MSNEILAVGAILVCLERTGFHYVERCSIVSFVEKHFSVMEESFLTIERKRISLLATERIEKLYRIENRHNPGN